MNRRISALGVCMVTIVSILAAVSPADSAAPSPALWGEAAQIGTLSPINSPVAAFNAMGVGFAAWQVQISSNDHIFGSRYTPATGWGPEEQLDLAGGTSPSQDQTVVVDSAGNAMAAWAQSNGAAYSVWAARFAAGSGWEPAVQIQTTAGDAYALSLGIDVSGNVLAVWGQYNGTAGNVWANKYDPGAGWGTASLIENDPDSTDPSVLAVAPNGDAVVVWPSFDGVRTNLWQNSYTPAGGWGTSGVVESDSYDAYNPAIAVDGSGMFRVAWTQWNGTRNVINSSSFTTSTGWTTPATVAINESFGCDNAAIAMNSRGDTLLVYSAYDPGTGWAGVNDIFALAYRVGSGWDAAPSTIANDSNNSFGTVVAIDAWGHGALTFSHESSGWPSRTDVWGAAWDINQGWYPRQRIETVNTGYAYAEALASDRTGRFFAAFQIEGPSTQLWGNWLTWADTTPPALAIASPMDAAVLDASPVHVTGTTEPGAHLVVNGLNVAVEDTGSWWVDLPLTAGNNTISAEAYDSAGNSASQTVTVWFTDPATYIQANLSATQALLSATRAQLTATQTQLSSAYSALNATKADLAATEGRLNSTSASLTTTKNDLGTANTNIASAQGIAMLGVGLGLVGIIIAVLGIMMGMRMMRKPGMGASSSAPPPAEPPR